MKQREQAVITTKLKNGFSLGIRNCCLVISKVLP